MAARAPSCRAASMPLYYFPSPTRSPEVLYLEPHNHTEVPGPSDSPPKSSELTYRGVAMYLYTRNTRVA
jgi:hypothetical protein